MLIVMMVHVLFGALTFVDQDAHHKYHDFHGWQGYFLIVCKLIIVGVHIFMYLTSKNKVKKNSLQFFEKVFKVGLIYLLTDPFAILSGFLLDEINR